MSRQAVTNLCRAIREALLSGLVQDAATRSAVVSATGVDDQPALARLLADADDPDAAVARAMLLHPGEDVKTALEPLAAEAACAPDEAELVGALLGASRPRALAVFPDGFRLELSLTPEEAATFVSRLRLANTPPPELYAALRTAAGPEAARRLAAVLRHAPTPLTPATRAFVQTVVSAAPAGVGPLDGLTAYAVRFADAMGPDESPEAAIGRRYRAVTGQIKQAQRLAHAMETSSYEVLLSQGARLPHLDLEALRREIAYLGLCARAFGLSGAGAGSDVIDRDLGDGLSAEELIGRLGGLDW